MSPSRNYLRDTRNVRMYSVVYLESNFSDFSGMVPEWFRKRSMYCLRVYWDNLMRIRFPVALSANICVTLSVVLSSYFGKGQFKCLKEYVGFLHNTFLGFCGKCTYAFRRQLFERVNICNRRYNLALGYGVDRILSCGGW